MVLTKRNALKLRVGLLAMILTVGTGSVVRRTVSAQVGDEAAVRNSLLKSASSFEKNDVAEATQVWVNDDSLTVFESGHANYGWADYRDHHLGPEMREMKNTKYGHSKIKIHLAGKTAWATFNYTISADVGETGKTWHVEGAGLATAVLEQRDGQ